MIHEIVYTSSEDTFDGPGYGVVAKTRGIPDLLLRHMLKLCRFDFLSESPELDEAKAMVSHTLVTDTEVWHVFSQAVGAGVDHTHRSVFLAHHVAIPESELRDVTPIQIALSRRLFRNTWSGPSEILHCRTVTEIGITPVLTRTWSDCFVDRDAKQFWLSSHSRLGSPVFLLSDSAQRNLQLFGEAASTMDPRDAMKLSFISALGADHKGVRFDWIGLINGSSFTDSIQKVLPDKILDVSHPEDFFAEALRASQTVSRNHLSARPKATVLPGRRPLSPEPEDVYELRWQEDETVSQAQSRPKTEKGKLPVPPPPPPVTSRRWQWILAVVCCAVAAGAGVVVLNRPSEVDSKATVDLPRTTPEKPVVASTAETPGTKGENPHSAPMPTQVPANLPVQPAASNLPAQPGAVVRDAVQRSSAPRLGDFYVSRGLAEVQDIGGGWVQIAKLPEGPRLQNIALLGAREMGLTIKTAETSLATEIRVALGDTNSPSVSIRCNFVTNTVEIQSPGKTASRIVQKMRLCCLRLQNGAEVGFNEQSEGFVTYRLALNTEWPELQSNMEPGKDTSHDPHVLDRHDLCLAITEELHGPAQLICHLDSVSLVPNSSGVAIQAEKALKGEEIVQFPFALTWRFKEVLFELPIQPFFDREARSSEPLIKVHPLVVLSKPPVEKDKGEPPSEATDEKTLPSNVETDSKQNKTPPSVKKDKKTSIKELPENSPAVSELGSIEDGDLLRECFSRFGKVSGKMTVRFGEPGQQVEYPIFRFGPSQ